MRLIEVKYGVHDITKEESGHAYSTLNNDLKIGDIVLVPGDLAAGGFSQEATIVKLSSQYTGQAKPIVMFVRRKNDTTTQKKETQILIECSPNKDYASIKITGRNNYWVELSGFKWELRTGNAFDSPIKRWRATPNQETLNHIIPKALVIILSD